MLMMTPLVSQFRPCAALDISCRRLLLLLLTWSARLATQDFTRTATARPRSLLMHARCGTLALRAPGCTSKALQRKIASAPRARLEPTIPIKMMAASALRLQNLAKQDSVWKVQPLCRQTECALHAHQDSSKITQVMKTVFHIHPVQKVQASSFKEVLALTMCVKSVLVATILT